MQNYEAQSPYENVGVHCILAFPKIRYLLYFTTPKGTLGKAPLWFVEAFFSNLQVKVTTIRRQYQYSPGTHTFQPGQSLLCSLTILNISLHISELLFSKLLGSLEFRPTVLK